MKLSRLHLKTLREAPNEAELVSHKLMIRANLIKKEAAGIYLHAIWLEDNQKDRRDSKTGAG